jgi:outer membrane protein TolC
MQRLNKWIILTIVLCLVSNPSWAKPPLTWTDCLLQASQNHPDLISAKEGVRQSKDSRTITASSLWPQASVDLGISRDKSHSPRTGSKSDTTTYDYGVSGSQLLFDGFKTVNNWKASGEDVKASQWNFQYVSSLVRFRLRVAFVNLLKAQESIKISKEIHAIRKQNLDLITLRYNSGTEHRGALLTAQANLAQANFEINQASRQLQVAQRNLLKEIGAKEFEPIEVAGTFDISSSYDQSPHLEQLVQQNPQLLKLRAQKNAASFDIKAVKGEFLPSVTLNGGVGKSDEEWAPRGTNTNVGIRVSLPLLEGGSRLAQLDQAKSVVRDLQAQEQSLKDALVLELAQTWASLEDAIEQVGVQKSFVMASEERAKISQQQYSVGLLDFDNWTIIEDSLVNVKKAYLNTQANALIAEANWIEAQGRNLEYAN